MSRRRPQGEAESSPDPTVDLAAELVSAKYDLQLLRQAFLAAWDDGLGYGPRAMDYQRPLVRGEDPAFRNVPLRFSPERVDEEGRITDVGGEVWSAPTWHRVRRSVGLLVQAQHDYGDLEVCEGPGTVWPTTPMEGRQVEREEVLRGVYVLMGCIAELQRAADWLSEADQAVALKVAEGCRAALKVMPEQLWREQVVKIRPCLDCGRAVQDSARRCYACRARLSRNVRAAIDRRTG